MSADAPHAANAPGFQALLAEVMATTERFGHREHVHLTWLAVRRVGVRAAIGLVSDGIQRTARYAGAPQKYHATVSRAWVELVGHHAAELGEDDFKAFADHHPALLDKRLLTARSTIRRRWPPHRRRQTGSSPTSLPSRGRKPAGGSPGRKQRGDRSRATAVRVQQVVETGWARAACSHPALRPPPSATARDAPCSAESCGRAGYTTRPQCAPRASPEHRTGARPAHPLLITHQPGRQADTPRPQSLPRS